MDFKNKYLKYKNKYIQLKKNIDTKTQFGGISGYPENHIMNIPMLGLGTWQAEPEAFDITNTIYRAIQIGYRCFDCAFAYKNEKKIGSAIRRAIDEGIVRREDLFIIGKATTIEQFNESLAKLQIHKFDLALYHFYNNHSDWNLMLELASQGKADKIGLSNIYENKLCRLLAYCDERSLPKPYAIENEVNFFTGEINLVNLCNRHGIKVIAYAPLGQLNLPILSTFPIITELSERYSITIPQLLLLWGIRRGLTVIPSSTNESRLIENLRVLDIQSNHDILTQDEVQLINKNSLDEPIISTAVAYKQRDQ